MRLFKAPCTLDVEDFIKRLKSYPGSKNAGMVLIHNGIVRATSRNGGKVFSMEVAADEGRLCEIMSWARGLPGVLAVDAEVVTGRLYVGDDIMLLGVAGDIRQNVIHALSVTLDRIKQEVTKKQEFGA